MYKYLALGDSYTIGEQVDLEKNFPSQTLNFLKEFYAVKVESPKIIAKTGWTTDELLAAIKEQKPADDFHLVTLLIGVNNQYRNYDIEKYAVEFQELLAQSIAFAAGIPQNVFVLSIPDWGQTPFAEGRDRKKIKNEINLFNKKNKEITDRAGCNYLDITTDTRMHGTNLQYLTPDLLHYSELEYFLWAERLSKMIFQSMTSN